MALTVRYKSLSVVKGATQDGLAGCQLEVRLFADGAAATTKLGGAGGTGGGPPPKTSRETFEELDADGSGFLSIDELKEFEKAQVKPHTVN